MNNGNEVREAQLEDLPSVVDIYNFEVVHGLSNYESVPRSLEQQQKWFTALREQGYPVLVVTRQKQIAAFGALTPFHSLSGYKKTSSAVIYVAAAYRRSGVGLELAQALQEAARSLELHTVIAGINAQNSACLGLLKQIGFTQVGYFKEIGFKNGQWQDDVCLQWMVNNSRLDENV